MSNKIYPIVMDTNFNRIAILDSYQSLIWTSRYYSHGDFELQIAATAENVELLTTGNYIVRDDDENVGIIEKVDLTISAANERLMKVSGRFLTAILNRRIVATQTQLTGNVSYAINRLLKFNIISPDIEARRISNFIDNDYEIQKPIDAQYTGKDLYTIISDLAVQYQFGFKITLNNNNQFVFRLYEGVDRSYNQSANPYIVFSDEYENLINAEFQKDIKGVVTAVLAAGEGEGLDRKTIWVENDNAPTGLNRCEYYDDSRNTSSNSGEIPEADYYKQLAEDGKASLTAYESTFAGEVNFLSVKFKEDVNVGDIVTIESKALGYRINARIIEVIESISSNGAYQIIPTFGK